MLRKGVLPFWSAIVVVVGIVSSLAGCASTSPPTPVAVTDVKSLAGKWAGVAQGPGSNQQDYVEMTIREDGTYEVTSSRTMGNLRGSGKVVVREGQVVLEGTHARGTGTLMSERGGERILRVNMTLEGAGGVPNNVQVNLRPTR